MMSDRPGRVSSQSGAGALAEIPPTVAAGILLLARSLCRELNLSNASVNDILDHTGAGRVRAYVQKDRMVAYAASARRVPGRPRLNSSEMASARTDIEQVTQSVLRYLMSHPGAVSGKPPRRGYSDGFRRHVVALCCTRRRRLAEISRAISVPLPTLRRWLKHCEVADALYEERCAGEHDDAASGPDGASHADTGPDSQIAFRIVHAWTRWSGSVVDFCRHLRDHLQIHVGRAAVRRILAAHGVRDIRPRSRRTAAKSAALTWRDSFERFFPGAQWTGDGARMAIWLDDQPYSFNVELMVDTANGAVVGASIRNEEDGTAVVEAFHDGVAAAGAAPLSLLLDNRPSNHATAVTEALGDTHVLRATPGRPQNKAHVEGAFGLFKQVAPDLRVTRNGEPPEKIARQILAMILTTWARTLNNHRPARRAHLSRAELYRSRVCTSVQADAARASLHRRRHGARWHKHDAHPLYGFVCSELIRLGLSSSTAQPRARSRLVARMLRFPNHAVVDGIAIYEAKREAGTLPGNADIRYLVGIVRRLAERCEGFLIAESLWRSRWAANTTWQAALEARRTKLEERYPPGQRLFGYIDAALYTDCAYDRCFWLDAAAADLNRQNHITRLASFELRRKSGLFAGYQRAAHHILATDALPYRERLELVQGLVARLAPVPA